MSSADVPDSPSDPSGHPRPGHLSASDTVLWDIDRDPVLRSTITAIALLDRSPDWDRLRDRLDQASHLIPRLRLRVEPPAFGIGPPRWVEDVDFDLDYHLRRVRVAKPGRLRDVLNIAQPVATAAFDPVRPLWEFTLVEGMRGGGAALVQKLHHCLTDGVGGIELALMLLDDSADAAENDNLADRVGPAPAGRSPMDLARAAVGLPFAATSAAASAAVSLAKDPVGSLAAAGELAGGVYRLLAPLPRTTPLMTRRSLRRRFHAVDIPLEDLRAAGHVAGGTLNDAFMAGVVEGLRRYHVLHDVEIENLSITMPVNLRRPGDDLGGNRFTPARFTVPATQMEPEEQMRAIGRVAHDWQHSPALRLTSAIAGTLDVLPPVVVSAVLGSMLKGIDTVVTNVPGLPAGCHLAGAEVVREYAMAPTSGAAVNVALVSVADTACIGIAIDLAAVPDDEVLVEQLVEGFRSVMSVVSQHPG